MFSKKIFLFIIFIIINNIISQSYNDPYYNDNNDESSNNDNDSDDKTGILIALICWSVIVFITTFAYVYCCICRDRRGSFATRNYHPDYLGDRVYLIPINNQNGQTNNIKQKGQNNNNVNSNQILNLNPSNLEVEINYLFQNIMKPEIYTEKFGKEEKSCSICSNKFKLNKSKIVLTLCHHFFHFYCLKKYLLEGKGKKCLNCNHDFFETFNSIKLDSSKIKIIPLDEKDNPNNEQ